MKNLGTLILIIVSFYGYNQHILDSLKKDSSEVLEVAEVMPEFPRGEEKLYDYLGKNLKLNHIKNHAIQSKITVSFIVEKDGSLTHIKCLKCWDQETEKNILEVITNMPKWIPGTHNEKLVRVRYTIPIRICLR